LIVGLILVAGGLAIARIRQSDSIEGVSFADKPGALYVPVRDLARAMGQEVDFDSDTAGVSVGSRKIHPTKHLIDGTQLIRVGDAKSLGASVDWDSASNTATVHYNDSSVKVVEGSKRVVVDKSQQEIRAYQGSRLVLSSRVSTGREGHGTPNGTFRAGPAKERMHLSRLYDWAPMPFSVQVDGNVFIHGFTSVPNRPASHGCIRMPLTGGNPAKWFYNWVDIGTPVTIKGAWQVKFHHRRHHRRTHRHHRYHRIHRLHRRVVLRGH
jgi:lipoprotein-anchoring transpeptidase ErfK/SrfK